MIAYQLREILKNVAAVPEAFSQKYDVLASIDYYLIEKDEQQHSETNTLVGKIFRYSRNFCEGISFRKTVFKNPRELRLYIIVKNQK